MTTALPTGARGQVMAVAMGALVLLLAWYAAGGPLVAWYGDRSETLAQRRLLAERMATVSASLPRLRREASAPASSPAVGPLLEGGSDALAGAALQARVEELARGNGIALSSAELLPVEAAGSYRRIGLRLAASGDWPAVVSLLQAIGGASPRMLVDELQVTPAPSLAAGAAQPLSVGLTVIAFRRGGA